MLCSYLLFTTLFGISICFVGDTVAHEAIIGGEKAEHGQFPYQVSVQVDNEHKCGGGIIAQQYILTAAHCIMDHYFHQELFNQLTIVAGTNNLHNLGTTGLRVVVEKAIVTSNYNESTSVSVGDITVLKLKHPLNLSNHGPLQRIKLPKNQHDSFDKKMAIIAGFGWIWKEGTGSNKIGNNTDGQLRFAHAQVVDCVHEETGEKHICAKVKQPSRSVSAGTCPGDSGSLLVDDDGTAIGILSGGPKSCTEKVHPAFYTRISHYLTFIRNAKEDKITKNMDEIFTSD